MNPYVWVLVRTFGVRSKAENFSWNSEFRRSYLDHENDNQLYLGWEERNLSTFENTCEGVKPKTQTLAEQCSLARNAGGALTILWFGRYFSHVAGFEVHNLQEVGMATSAIWKLKF